MSESIQPIDTSANSQINTNLVIDEQLDNQEITSAKKREEKYHDYLGEVSAEQSRMPVKDKMARLALIVAQKNLSI
ncbi:hypothetical protein EOPP23_10180 [Endozoicomonas sp. OPT23]|uniref:hypothetical protein n=1 Tax=Endozoicomonas sp. OPT23 TaxID=2072845 RepID=UPI00129B0F6B|nr:hypothetical protein [Endozoicomonas sp. OPT23]MRI33351.1 hypothetical protein [Endozoicomonas sp. OPT23]